MTHNDTRISNERLAERGVEVLRLLSRSNDRLADVAVISSWVHDVRQALRSTPVEAEPDLFITEDGTALAGNPAKLQQMFAGMPSPPAGQKTIPLYALPHPLPNPSPSDGEVSDVLRRARNYIDDMPHLFPENAHPNDRDTHRQLEAEREPLLLALTAAIQSKRGHP